MSKKAILRWCFCAKYKTSSKFGCSQCGCGILSSLYFLKNSFLFHSFPSYLRDDANKVLDTNIFFHCTCRQPYHIMCWENNFLSVFFYYNWFFGQTYKIFWMNDEFSYFKMKCYQNISDINKILIITQWHRFQQYKTQNAESKQFGRKKMNFEFGIISLKNANEE